MNPERSSLLIPLALAALILSACVRSDALDTTTPGSPSVDDVVRESVRAHFAEPGLDVAATLEHGQAAFAVVRDEDGYQVVALQRAGDSWRVTEAEAGIDAPLPTAGSRAYLLTMVPGAAGEFAGGGFVDPDVDRVVASAPGRTIVGEARPGLDGSVLILFPANGDLRLYKGGCIAYAGSFTSPGDAPSAELPTDPEGVAAAFLRLIQEETGGALHEANRLTLFPEDDLAGGLAQVLGELPPTDWLRAERVKTGYSLDLRTSAGYLSIVAGDVAEETKVLGYSFLSVCP